MPIILTILLILLSHAARAGVESTGSRAVYEKHQVRALPGQLDCIPVFNSNSPEIVQQEGILLSTLPGAGRANESLHLNTFFKGRFDVFAHHIAKASSKDDLRTLYIGFLLKNTGDDPVNIDVLTAASYLSQPDAPFIALPDQVENGGGAVYAGPGDRVTNEVLRGRKHNEWPDKLTIGAGASAILRSLAIPVSTLNPPVNGRSLLARLESDGPIYLASLAMFAKKTEDGTERPPNLAEWEELLNSGKLAGPRDKTPTPPVETGHLVYGRVAGIAVGSKWTGTAGDNGYGPVRLTIPSPDRPVSYVLSSVARGTHGTGQIQSAPLAIRYPDTAYAAHGNYGIEYNITLPLYNNTSSDREVSITLQTPVKSDSSASGLQFFTPAPDRIFFRGTIRVSYEDRGQKKSRYIHLVQRQGQKGARLLTLPFMPGQTRVVQVDFIYPPDATPPQVLTIATEQLPRP